MAEELRNERGQTLSEFLAEYDAGRYPRPSCTVDMLLMTVSEGQLKLLLVKRRDHPFLGDWAMPGGFVGVGEDLDKAVARELEEETHITRSTYFQQLYTFGKADRDPRTRVITTAYLSLTPESNIRETRAGDDAAEAVWFSISKKTVSMDGLRRVSLLEMENAALGIGMEYEITDTVKGNYIQTRSRLMPDSKAKLAGDHIKAVNMAMDLVQHKAASTGIIFNLLPPEATLREIQTVYEAVKGEKADTGNFRRDIQKMLSETGNVKTVRGKPAKLFRFNPLYKFL